ncbi:dihydrodipicolinate synthetase family protein [Sarocladium implicatum]|nr:dihydrodipicolinate synthetase family protein [Sarocladium implicatum]
MAPHNDAPSPAGSFAPSFRLPYRQTASLRLGPFASTDSDASLSSSFNSTAVDEDFQITRPLVPGVYVPTMCFFKDNEDVDVAVIARHVVRLAKAGVTGLATQGSNGEAVHLTRSERQLVTATTRGALNDAGYPDLPLIVGCGSQSTRETIQLCQDACDSGGDYALVLPPSYYAGLFAPASATIKEFFTTVADKSPIPIIIYNFPGAAGGLDLSSDTIIQLAEHPNIIGVKLTCGNTGKLNRIATATRRQSKNFDPAHPDFVVLAGSADFTIQALAGGGHGILAGLANISPKACVQTMKLYKEGKLEEASDMQETVSNGDWTAIQGGVVGVKAGLQAWMGYGGYARSPLPKPSTEESLRWKEGFRDLFALEKSL